MAIARRKLAEVLVGAEKPRIGPPVPARTRVADFVTAASDIGLELMPWQRYAGRFLYAVGPDDQWLYPEVAIVVARQNGKTKLLKPHIIQRLREGRHIMHAAQTRELPRLLFKELAPTVESLFGSKATVRRGAGQETIEIEGGAFYKIVAASGGAPRGLSIDDLLLDELRELEPDFIEAAVPTTMASLNAQTVYLSNAGTDETAALNAVRLRAETDPALAYLEWSAAQERAADDRAGWAEANPSIGHFAGLEGALERQFRSHSLAGTLTAFETENLCRWVATMRERLVDDARWMLCRNDDLEAPPRNASVMAVSMSPNGRRASAAVAWIRPDQSVGLRLLFNVTGDPVPSAEFGNDLARTVARLGIRRIGFDPLTDAELAKYFKKPKPEALSGQKFTNASAQFVNSVHGRVLHWSAADAVTDDLTWTSRKHDHETGSYQAVRAQDDRPITASLAAIRAVYLASGPKPATPKVM